MTERLLRAREVAPLLGVEMATVVDYAQRGLIPCVRLGGTKYGRLRFRPSDIEDAVEDWATLPEQSRRPVERRPHRKGQVSDASEEYPPRG